MGLETRSVNRFMAWGLDMEGKAILDFEVSEGKIVRPGGLWIHPDFDWLAASPDGLINDDGVLEVKCPHALPESIPEKHRIQIRVQIAVTGRSYGTYLAWTPDGTFLSRLERDVDEEQYLIAALSTFYTDYVLTGIQPHRKKPVRKAKELA